MVRHRAVYAAVMIASAICASQLSEQVAWAASAGTTGTATVDEDSSLSEARAAAQAAAKEACADAKKAKSARITVTAGDAQLKYTIKCATVAKDSTTATTPGASGSTATATVGLVGTANPTFPAGTKGELTVVASGPLDRGSAVPVVVRNNTSRAVTRVEVEGSARDAAGALVGSGESQGLEPSTLAPGAIAIGYVYFGSAPNATQFTFTVDAQLSKGSGKDYNASVIVTEHNYSEETRFSLAGSKIVGALSNPLAISVDGPISILAMCFDEGGQPLRTLNGFAESDDLAPAATTTFSLEQYDATCPSYLLGASGYNEAAL